MIALIADVLQNDTVVNFFTYLATIYAALLTLVKTPLGKKLLEKSIEEGTQAAKHQLGIDTLTDKIDGLDAFTRRHLENGDETPMVERMKLHNKEQQECAKRLTVIEDYLTRQNPS